jgi:ArsR family transcriptional regulator
MSISVNMMTAVKIEIGLLPRLIRLTGDDSECCIPDYREGAAEISGTVEFARTLRRARALADANRLTTAGMLRRDAELCACELQAGLGLSHATVSHHMRVLEEAGLVTSERRGKWVYYQLVRDAGVRIP